MRICEIFDSIDGEGLRTGLAATFIRTAGCNLRCPYCDTKYSWDSSGAEEMSIDDILTRVNPVYKRVTLTGGEPLLQADAAELIARLIKGGAEVNVETNGAADIRPFLDIADPQELLFFTIDYKLPSSGETAKMLPGNFRSLRKRDAVKFVIGDDNDIQYMREVMREFSLPNVFLSAVFGQMEPARLAELVSGDLLFKNARVQLQIHKYIWDPDERGV